MKPTLDTRKPIEQITLEDLDTFPIWEFASDEEGEPDHDETWIRPVLAQKVPGDEYSQIVAATFGSDPSSSLAGFMVVSTAEQPVELSPGAIVTDKGYHFIPAPQMFCAERERATLTETLGIRFPLAYRLLVIIEGEAELREGVIQ